VYILGWKDTRTPPDPALSPTHVIALMENGKKHYELGRMNHTTRPSEVRLIPRTERDPVPCFQVGSNKIALFGGFLKNYCEPVEKAKVSLFGISFKPLDAEDFHDQTEMSGEM